MDKRINQMEKQVESAGYALISPKQFYARINRDLDIPIGLASIYRLVKQDGFPSVCIGGRIFVVESKVDEWLKDYMKKDMDERKGGCKG